MARVLDFLISIYQKTLSPDHGLLSVYYPHGFCRFYPTCSTYTRESLRKYGIFRGFWRSAIRILRCNPLSQGGVDRV